MTSFLSTKFKDYSSDNRFWILCILAVSCAAVLPIALMGIPDNPDLPEHLRFARTFHSEIQNFNFSPGWAADDNAGFGSVGVRFYPPITPLLMALTQLITNSWFDTLWTNILLWMFIGCVGVFFWAKEWLPPPQAATAAIFYAAVPYHLFQVYQAFLFAEFAAVAILPFCFLFAGRIVTRGRLIDVICFATAFSGLILSHIPSTIIGSLSLAIYIAVLLERRFFFRSCVRFLGAFALSLAATSFHLVRFLTELAWVKVSSTQFYGSGYLNYASHLFPMFFNGGDFYTARLLWILDITIILTFLLFVPLAVFFVARAFSERVQTHRRSLTALCATGLFAFFMMSSASAFLWSSAEFLQKLQFPWRWLSVASLVGSVAFAIGVSEIRNVLPSGQRVVWYGVASLIFVILLFDITQQILPSSPVSRENLAATMEKIDQEKGCSCWWPTWAEETAFGNPERVAAGSRAVEISEWKAETRSFAIEAGTEPNARIATFYYPHWKAEVNGIPTEVQKAADGTITIPLDQQASHVHLFFEEPYFLSAANAISLITWAGLLFGLLASKRRTNGRTGGI